MNILEVIFIDWSNVKWQNARMPRGWKNGNDAHIAKQFSVKSIYENKMTWFGLLYISEIKCLLFIQVLLSFYLKIVVPATQKKASRKSTHTLLSNKYFNNLTVCSLPLSAFYIFRQMSPPNEIFTRYLLLSNEVKEYSRLSMICSK